MSSQHKDILWKGIIQDLFRDFLLFFFKDASRLFDFSRGCRFLDKELSQLWPDYHIEHPMRTDSLIQLYNKEGGEHAVLVHVEIQGYREKGFGERLFTYYYRLRDRYRMPLTTLVIYLDKRTNMLTSSYEETYLGTGVKFHFNTYYIGEQREEELSKHVNPFAIVILAALSALRYRKDEDLFLYKKKLITHLLNASISRNKIRILINFIKLYLQFGNQELNIRFDAEIQQLTNQKPPTMKILEYARQVEREELMMGIAKKMLKDGLDINAVHKYTEISLEKLSSILKELKR